MPDRTEMTRALARALAHKQAGNHDKAARHARELVTLLVDAGILPATEVPA